MDSQKAQKVVLASKAWAGSLPKGPPALRKAGKWIGAGVGALALAMAVEVGSMVRVSAPVLLRGEGKVLGVLDDYEKCQRGPKAAALGEAGERGAQPARAALACFAGGGSEERAREREAAVAKREQAKEPGKLAGEILKAVDPDWREDERSGARDGDWAKSPMGALLGEMLAARAVEEESSEGDAEAALEDRREAMAMAKAGMRAVRDEAERAKMAEAAAPMAIWMAGKLSNAGPHPLAGLQERTRIQILKGYWRSQHPMGAASIEREVQASQAALAWANQAPLDEQGALAAIEAIGPR